MDSKTTENFMDKNFNFINLLLFAGLYIACFVYLLQDTVKSIDADFSSIIGMFVGEVVFLIILFIIMNYETMNITNMVLWSVLIIAGIVQVISGGFLLIKYKNMQDRGDNTKIIITDSTADKLGDEFKNNSLNIYKYLLIGAVLSAVLVLLSRMYFPLYTSLSIILLMIVLCISGFMLYTSIVISGGKTSKPEKGTDSKISPKIIPALIFLCIYQIFFTFFISFIISKKISSGTNLLLKLSWGSVFITTIFQIISLFIVIVSYTYFDDKFISKYAALPNSDFIIKELKDYNNLFVSVTVIIIVFIAILLKGHDFLNDQKEVIFNPYFYSVFIILLGIACLSISSEMIKISNDLLTFKNTIPLPSDKETNSDTPASTTPSSTTRAP
jgi:hypothetical protein